MGEKDTLLSGKETGCNYFRSKTCNKLFPYDSKQEFKEQIIIAWPIALTQLLQYIVFVVSLGFCGYIGKDTLDASALATTIINVMGNSVIFGLASACDTLFSQTYGSRNRDQLGIVVQRSCFILFLGCIPCCAVMMNTEWLLLLVHQDPIVSMLAGKYTLIFIAALPGTVFFVILSKYLQSQGIVFPSLIIGVLSNIANAGMHAVFINVFGLGINGAAVAVTITQWIVVALHICYIKCSGVYKETWSGWNIKCLYDWGKFVALAIPGLLMVCIEWWSYEVLALIIGTIDITKLAAHVIAINVSNLIFMIPLGQSVAASVRVGNHLGASNAAKALTASRVSIALALCTACIFGICLSAFRYYIPMAFSKESDILEIARKLVPLMAIFNFIDCIQVVASGVIRGIGLQKFGAINNFIVFYFIALPLSIVLLFLTSLNIFGVWYGMIIGTSIQTCVFIIRIVATNWEKESAKAQIRIGVVKKKEVNTDEKLCNTTEEDYPNSSSIEMIRRDVTCNGNQSNVLKENLDCDKSVSLKRIIMYRLLIVSIFLIGLICAVLLRLYIRLPKQRRADYVATHLGYINSTATHVLESKTNSSTIF